MTSIPSAFPSGSRETGLSPSAKCRHCGGAVPSARRAAGDEFCCPGCASVHAFLRELDLDRAYDSLKGGRAERPKPIVALGEDFSVLDRPPYRNRGEPAALDFFVEGIHCTACVWVLERLPGMAEGIAFARLDSGRSLLRVGVTEKGRFEEVVGVLAKLGYRAHPTKTAGETEARIDRADRATLKRIGVAAFSAMNVMIYSVALYAEVDGGYAELFRWLSLATALPALTYSAWPFYLSASRALRAGRISIDLPISLAFVGGLAESVRQAALGTNELYLDSATSLVFLMLISRYALSRLERSETSKAGLLRAFLPSKVWKIAEGHAPRRIGVHELKIGDLVVIANGEKIPVDGTIGKGSGAVDLAFLTGETKPVRVRPGDRVYAGGTVVGGELVVRVGALGRETRIGELEARLEWTPARKNARVELADRWARAFLAIVLGLAAALFAAFGPEHLDEAIRRSLSLLIVACPCALALATPLTLARALRVAADRGILVRDVDAFDRAAVADRVVFDKTGTLTAGYPEVTAWEWEAGVSERRIPEWLSIAYSLEARSRHPYGRAIARHLENRPGVRLIPEVDPIESSRGVAVKRDGSHFFLGAADDDRGSGVEFRVDGAIVARIRLADSLRAEAPRAVAELRRAGLAAEIVSGDDEGAVRTIAERAGIGQWAARATPASKARLVEDPRRARAIVVGDGVNDALALRRASVGVAFSRGRGEPVEALLASSAVTILDPDLGAIPELVAISRRYRRTLRRNAVFSAGYNLIAASLAAAGFIHPLLAAVVMPVSALTVYLSTVAGLRGKGAGG